jgi:alginate O-acetyltransferase complex protein AlgI
MPQFTNNENRKFNSDNFSRGIYIFCIGLFKKVVIADTVALFVNNGFELSYFSMPTAWIVALSYTLQIYFDFSGYSDMAIGLGKMFNINIPANFDSPYTSESITVFWRKWHITLGRALSTYIYVPLGGNRKGKLRTYANLLITFFVSGLWHGASWTFALWGLMHGIFVVVERMFKNAITHIPRFIKIAATFLVVNFLWVLFRASNFTQAITVYKGMFNFNDLSVSQISSLCADGIVTLPSAIALLYVVGLVFILCGIVFFAKNSLSRLERFSPTMKNMCFCMILFIISVIHLSRLSVFIYFNF